jgi:hypothetical protein
MNTTTTNWHYQQARRAIDGTGLSIIGNTGGSVATKVVSDPAKRQVWLRASIIADDETVLLTWRTTNGVEVARSIRLAIDANLPAMIAALAAVEVNA